MARLTKTEERELWQRWRSEGDLASREALIRAYLYLVPITRQRACRLAPPRLHDDLEAAGHYGLIRAVDRFDPTRLARFATFAICWIRGAMLEELRREDWAPRSVHRAVRAGQAVAAIELVSLEGMKEDPDERPLLERLAAPDPAAGSEAESRLDHSIVARLVEWLPRPERALIRAEFWEGQSLHEIAVQSGAADSTMRLWRHRAYARLRGWLADWEGSAVG